jgi:hypothetical protein
VALLNDEAQRIAGIDQGRELGSVGRQDDHVGGREAQPDDGLIGEYLHLPAENSQFLRLVGERQVSDVHGHGTLSMVQSRSVPRLPGWHCRGRLVIRDLVNRNRWEKHRSIVFDGSWLDPFHEELIRREAAPEALHVHVGLAVPDMHALRSVIGYPFPGASTEERVELAHKG